MFLSYHHNLGGEVPAGLATEISALTTFVVAGLVQREHYWIATTIGVLSVLLLELKKGLESLTTHIESAEIITVAKFLVLSVVVLPIVPNRDFTPFHLNPFKTWLVVVAISGVSFASYLLQRLIKNRGGVMLSPIRTFRLATALPEMHVRSARRPGRRHSRSSMQRTRSWAL